MSFKRKYFLSFDYFKPTPMNLLTKTNQTNTPQPTPGNRRRRVPQVSHPRRPAFTWTCARIRLVSQVAKTKAADEDIIIITARAMWILTRAVYTSVAPLRRPFVDSQKKTKSHPKENILLKAILHTLNVILWRITYIWNQSNIYIVKCYIKNMKDNIHGIFNDNCLWQTLY